MTDQKYTVQLKKASELTSSKSSTTTSGIASDFADNKFTLFYHTYNPNNSFIAVPPELLKELAERAGEAELSNEITIGINSVKEAKQRVIDNLKQNYHLKQNKKD